MFEFIESNKIGVAKYAYPIAKMCRWLNVSKSGFFDWRKRPTSATANRRAELAAAITDIFDASAQRYGYRRVHAQLVRQGLAAGPELVRHIMADLGLLACQPRPWRTNLTTGDGHQHPIPDLLEQDFTADAPGLKLVGDITYIPTWEGWLYLATVIDCHTKMVIGYATDDHYRTPLISAALHDAARQQQLAPQAIFHTDRGSNPGFNRSLQHLP